MLHYKVWVGENQAWKIDRSRLYALVMVHCPPNLEEILKMMSAWNTVREAHDAIDLLKMVRNVTHEQTEAKQTVMGFLGSTAELSTYHQEEKTSDVNYSIMFNATVESIKAHGGQPWHHPGLADLHKKWIGKEMARREPDPENISPTHRTEIAKVAI